jgi:hypothetical protein
MQQKSTATTPRGSAEEKVLCLDAQKDEREKVGVGVRVVAAKTRVRGGSTKRKSC